MIEPFFRLQPLLNPLPSYTTWVRLCFWTAVLSWSWASVPFPLDILFLIHLEFSCSFSRGDQPLLFLEIAEFVFHPLRENPPFLRHTCSVQFDFVLGPMLRALFPFSVLNRHQWVKFWPFLFLVSFFFCAPGLGGPRSPVLLIRLTFLERAPSFPFASCFLAQRRLCFFSPFCWPLHVLLWRSEHVHLYSSALRVVGAFVPRGN